MATPGKTVLVTGGSGFIGRRLVQQLSACLDRERDRLVLLSRPKGVATAQAALAPLGGAGEVLEGDVTRMHLGLSGAEYKALAAGVTEVWHLAGLYGAGADALRAVNVEGTRNVLELASGAPRLVRLHHFSTVHVAGAREGVILEEELDVGQGFHDTFERSKFEGERLVRAAIPGLPVTIYRPSVVVGDSRTGEVDRFEGLYHLAILIAAAPRMVSVPLPGAGRAPLNVVPIDFLVEAALSIGANPAALGRTVHLTDPAPLSARKVYALIAARAGKSLPAVALPHRALDAILGLPLVERLARPYGDAIRMLNHLAIYNCQNQLELLHGTGIRCPPLTSYLDRLMAFARSQIAAPSPGRGEEDPLEGSRTPRRG